MTTATTNLFQCARCGLRSILAPVHTKRTAAIVCTVCRHSERHIRIDPATNLPIPHPNAPAGYVSRGLRR